MKINIKLNKTVAHRATYYYREIDFYSRHHAIKDRQKEIFTDIRAMARHLVIEIKKFYNSGETHEPAIKRLQEMIFQCNKLIDKIIYVCNLNSIDDFYYNLFIGSFMGIRQHLKTELDRQENHIEVTNQLLIREIHLNHARRRGKRGAAYLAKP